MTVAVPAGPLAEVPCHASPDLWFAQRPDDVEAAKALCLPCPRRAACLSAALERAEPWGVWGGQLVVRGVVVPRKRSRGRPPTRSAVVPAQERHPQEAGPGP